MGKKIVLIVEPFIKEQGKKANSIELRRSLNIRSTFCVLEEARKTADPQLSPIGIGL